jgi:hypothetical protein
MAFMLLFIDRKGAPGSAPSRTAELAGFERELARQGKLLRCGRLGPEADGARVAVQDGTARVTEGPFADSREVVGGFWIVEAADRAEAIALARRAFEIGEPQAAARQDAIDVHQVRTRYSVGPDPGTGTAFLLAFHADPFLEDCDGAKLQEMIEYGAALARDGKLFETTPLERSGAPARIESRGGKTLVTEGPFAEAKEVIGGFSLLRAVNRAEAIDIARRYPAARWGTVEVRPIVEPG